MGNNTMKKINSIKTTTFKTGYEDFMMDIVEYTDTLSDGSEEELFGCWIYRKNMGVKEFIVGEFKRDNPDLTVEQFADEMMDYCSIDNGNGDVFDFYDEQYE